MMNRNYKQGRDLSGVCNIGKFVVAALIVIYVACLFIFTSGSSKSFEEVAGPVDGMINKSRMVKATDRDVKKFYGLNTSDYEGVMCYISKNTLSAEEVLVLKVKDEDQIKDVKDAVNMRLEKRKSDFKGYAPDEEMAVDNAVFSIRGKFVFLSIGPDSDKQKEIFYSEL